MKRSEAIKIIQSVLDQSYDHPAVTILMKLEDAGLEPPRIKATHAFLGDEWGMINEWEEE